MTLAADLVANAIAKGLTLTTAESCTGGMVSAALTDIAGSSAMFERGFVTYSNGAKIEMLGVSPETLSTHGAVSEPVAVEMALGAARSANASIAVAITGIAGPGGSDHKPEGMVCFGIAASGATKSETVQFGAIGRPHVRAKSTLFALEMLKEAVELLALKK